MAKNDDKDIEEEKDLDEDSEEEEEALEDDADSDDADDSDEEADDSEDDLDEDDSDDAEESDEEEESDDAEEAPPPKQSAKKQEKAVARATDEAEADDGTPANLGATKYVHAAFFAFGILVAYLSGKILGSIWNTLAEWPAAVRQVPQLLSYSEDERPTFTMAAGALIGVITVIQSYRKESIRTWASEVALELSKVTWPNKETVTNGTIVVCVASVVATIYIALLDKFWGFVTQLVYGV